MRIIGIAILLALFIGSVIARAADAVTPSSLVSKSKLRVDFAPECVGGVAQLSSTITNVTSDTLTIRSGSWPWQYDVLGSRFRAVASGKRLRRTGAAPLEGRTGPVRLEAHEEKSGLVPITLLFPELASLLTKGPVEIHWKYWFDAVTTGAVGSLEGKIVMRSNPCTTQ